MVDNFSVRYSPVDCYAIGLFGKTTGQFLRNDNTKKIKKTFMKQETIDIVGCTLFEVELITIDVTISPPNISNIQKNGK